MLRRRNLKFIDLFAGAGGLAYGFQNACDDLIKFRSVFAVESDPAAAASYSANFGHIVFNKPIESLRRERVPDADVVIGGPPCQGFSMLGRVSPTDHHSKMNKLWRHFFTVVEWVRPVAFVIENVPEFLKSYEYKEVELRARKLGYDVNAGILNALHFGVPQSRKRGFVIGVRAGKASLPEPPVGWKPRTLQQAIGDLVEVPLQYEFSKTASDSKRYVQHKAFDLHLGRRPTSLSLTRYKCIPPGGNRFDLMRKRRDLTPRCWLKKESGSTDVFGRLRWDLPSFTIRTEFFKPEKGCYLHPSQDRPITHWEAARIQTFPDDFKFCGSKIEIARQIGNAVPPALGAAVARHVAQLLSTSKSDAERTSTLRPDLAEQINLALNFV